MVVLVEVSILTIVNQMKRGKKLFWRDLAKKLFDISKIYDIIFEAIDIRRVYI